MFGFEKVQGSKEAGDEWDRISKGSRSRSRPNAGGKYSKTWYYSIALLTWPPILQSPFKNKNSLWHWTVKGVVSSIFLQKKNKSKFQDFNLQGIFFQCSSSLASQQHHESKRKQRSPMELIKLGKEQPLAWYCHPKHSMGEIRSPGPRRLSVHAQ